MAIGVKKVARPRKMSFGEVLYLVEIVKGLGVTMGHLLRNIVRQENIPTIEYPEVRRVMPPPVPGSAPADEAARRVTPVRGVLLLLHGVPRGVHHDRRRGVPRPEGREVP